MKQKEISVVFYKPDFVRADWRYDVDGDMIAAFFAELADELSSLGVAVRFWKEHEVALPVKGYADLLNTVRIRSPKDSLGNVCLGHIIGKSANADLIEDIRRGVNRVAFAPEMVEPEGSDKIVCHNCGCGC
ncbi:MAG: hypothetical protein GWO11_05155 [Desulfuromonadales bacterium]|nr:hypothetical protein [Desulfuromonadales bacterium]NIR33786.1 hypothetical protein [Desulfuromonadales bacterium]NIS42470.1 hypothetical protein [Desulfuromonadales bacterium]